MQTSALPIVVVCGDELLLDLILSIGTELGHRMVGATNEFKAMDAMVYWGCGLIVLDAELPNFGCRRLLDGLAGCEQLNGVTVLLLPSSQGRAPAGHAQAHGFPGALDGLIAGIGRYYRSDVPRRLEPNMMSE